MHSTLPRLRVCTSYMLPYLRHARTVLQPHPSQLHDSLFAAAVRYAASMPCQTSQRIAATDAPIIVKTKRLMAASPGAVSLAQGIVHWQPPPHALRHVTSLHQSGAAISGYGPAEGLPALREALRHKLATDNGLLHHDVMVTAGANQAVLNAVLALVDAGDAVLLFKPYYFNHLMAIQMAGGARTVELGECDPTTLHPDLAWLEQRLQAQAQGQGPRLRMVIITNPCNPTGVLMSEQEIKRAAQLCASAGCWLLLDNTYEDFLYGGRQHYCSPEPHVVHVFSMSKAYGMMGWRVGYLGFAPDAAPPAASSSSAPSLSDQLLKVQDTTIICPPQLSQHLALAALQPEGRQYVAQQVQGLEGNRAAVLDALSPLAAAGSGGLVAGGEGAIYYWARLPAGFEQADEDVFAWLVQRHGVCVIPGSSCGVPGHIRAAFANLQPQACVEAAARLKAGLQELVGGGVSPDQLRVKLITVCGP